MHRVLVALLTALDAVVAAAVGIAVALAPLTLLWVFALAAPEWSDLWPASAAVWQLGHLVPLAVTLPDAYLASAGIPAEAASFTVSLAPLAFAGFTAVFAARSGGRAAGAGAWLTGVLSGSVVFAIVAAGVALTSGNPVLSVEAWQAVLLPALVYALPALLGAWIGAWREGDGGVVDAVRGWTERLPHAWADVPALAVRGVGIVAVGLAGIGALVVLIAVLTRGSEVVALFQTSNVDALGATVVALGQLVYLPTLVAWGAAYAAGPGFAVGSEAAVAPGSAEVGVIPGIPVLGLVPPSTSSWLLVIVLLPIGLGALTGWMLRARIRDDAVAPRLVLATAVALGAAAVAALVALLSSGSLGPGQLAAAGPDPGPLALSVGVEIALGCGILLLSPRPRAARLSPARSVPFPEPRPSGAPSTWFPAPVHPAPETPDAEVPDAEVRGAVDRDAASPGPGGSGAAPPGPGTAGSGATGSLEPEAREEPPSSADAQPTEPIPPWRLD